MGFELDPVFHTETMVKILQNQGHLFYAAQICEKVLSKDPDNLRLQALIEGFKKNSFKTEKTTMAPEEEITDPGTPLEALAASEGFASIPSNDGQKELKQKKLEKLHQLLKKIQERS